MSKTLQSRRSAAVVVEEVASGATEVAKEVEGGQEEAPPTTTGEEEVVPRAPVTLRHWKGRATFMPNSVRKPGCVVTVKTVR